MARLLYQALLVVALAHAGTQSRNNALHRIDGAHQRCGALTSAQIRVDSGHPWRPPFGIDRVGAPLIAHIEITGNKDALQRSYYVTSYARGQKIEHQALNVDGQDSPFFGTARLTGNPDTVVLASQCAPDEPTDELTRQRIVLSPFEAAAVARPDQRINPVDLNTILVPYDWLLLADRQSAVIDIAALSRVAALPAARVRAWFDGSEPHEMALWLTPNRRSVQQMRVPLTTNNASTTLNIAILNGRRELWHKKIPTMVITAPPRLPAFGAVQTKLRYDAPIAMGHEKKGKSQHPLDYQKAWDSSLKDVIVALPNGTRFVFWRGASYIPFWAGPYNTGLAYQWAEGLDLQAPNAEGGQEMPEPLNDKELRYSSVQILESTASRVHVRWIYQATDITYQTWGDQPTEDYYFYPDGFGTRVVTLMARPEAQYELSEFISVIPQAAFPLEILSTKVVDMVYLDGEHKSLSLPLGQDWKQVQATLNTLKKGPAVYRIYQDQHDPDPAIYYSLTNPPPRMGFGPLYDRGEMVTPAYWGDHWPLSRGKLTRYYIHPGLFTGPSHCSFMGWTGRDANGWIEGNPDPISVSTLVTIDAKGTAKPMLERRWTWLIGKSAASDEQLRAWGTSFSNPPSVTLKGARLDVPSYVQERRAIRLVAQSPQIEIKVMPRTVTINPVFELSGVSQTLVGVTVDGRSILNDAYAWDGRTLWIRARIDASGATIRLHFQ